MAAGIRTAGEFCWINMLTPAPDQARAFFEKLLGWSYFEMPGMGHGIQVGGENFGGLFDLNGPNTPPGTPPLIGVMVKVQSADLAAATIRANGGRAMEPFDIMNNLRMSVCHDPTGANFDLWESKQQQGFAVDAKLPGAPSWFETMTTDIDVATEFYVKVFGWTAQPMPMSPGVRYTVFNQGEVQVAGMMQITPDMGPIPSHWGVYFTVTDADKTAALATELGAKLFVPPTDIPNIGRFCGIISPQGVRFYVIAYAG